MRSEINDGSPIMMMTVGELREVLGEVISGIGDTRRPGAGRHYVHGIRGIERLFGVSHKTAQDYKNTFLRPAVMQKGRKIVVDADLAMELFNNREKH